MASILDMFYNIDNKKEIIDQKFYHFPVRLNLLGDTPVEFRKYLQKYKESPNPTFCAISEILYCVFSSIFFAAAIRS